MRVHMSWMSSMAEQCGPVEGGGCISEVSFDRGFTVHKTLVIQHVKDKSLIP